MTLDVIPGAFAICRLSAGAALPAWASRSSFSSITRTGTELSIVCALENVPPAVQAQRGYRGLVVRGPLTFAVVGIVAALSGPLAAAAISIFVVSTYDTDYLLVRDTDLAGAIGALRVAGHTVVSGA